MLCSFTHKEGTMVIQLSLTHLQAVYHDYTRPYSFTHLKVTIGTMECNTPFLTHSFNQSINQSHWLTHSLTHSLTGSLTHIYKYVYAHIQCKYRHILNGQMQKYFNARHIKNRYMYVQGQSSFAGVCLGTFCILQSGSTSGRERENVMHGWRRL